MLNGLPFKQLFAAIRISIFGKNGFANVVSAPE